MRRRTISLVLALLMVLSLMPFGVRAAEIVDSGSCGNNITWTLDSNGQLVISGSGSMNYGYSTSSWRVDHESDIIDVVIQKGITSIGYQAFRDCSNLTSISIPDSVESIGTSAFRNCVNLSSVTIRGPVKRIEFGTFYECKKLKYAVLPDGLTYIDEFAFHNCESMTSVNVPSQVTVIGKAAFQGCESLKEVVLPEGITEICDYTFNGCESLKSIVIPDGVTRIGERAFAACEELRDITIPASVTSIGENVFNSVSPLIIPRVEAGSYAQEYALERWKRYSLISDPETIYGLCGEEASWVLNAEGTLTISGSGEISGTYWNAIRSEIIRVIIQNGIESISRNCFSYGSNMIEVVIPESVLYIDSHAFISSDEIGPNDNLQNINVNSANPNFYSIDGILYNKQDHSLLLCPRGKMGTITVPSGTAEIFNYAFRKCTRITSISIPNSVSSIDKGAFTDCTALENIILSNGISSIGESAFYNCNQLVLVELPETVTSIGSKAFGYTGYQTKTQFIENKIEGFTIRGYSGSEAEAYAEAEGFVWQSVDHVVTFDACGGIVNQSSKRVVNGSLYGDLPTPTRTGYTFDGWYTASIGGSKITSSTTVSLTADQTLYAHWTANQYTVTFNANGGSVSPSSKTVTYAVAYGDLPTATRTGYFFDGWYTESSGGSKITSSTTVGTAANHTLYAHWSEKNSFQWGRDNWNYNNSSYQGYFNSSRYIDQIDGTYLSKLKNSLNNSEYDAVFNTYDGWLYDDWGGSCYGMSSLTLLAKEGMLPFSQYKSGATSLNQLSYPKADGSISSLVTYYQMLQVKDVIQRQYRTVPSKTNKENIEELISLLTSNDTVLVGFQKSGWGGHAILAYDVEYGSYTWDNVTYQGCIKICDPNASMSYNSRYNIYFNTRTYNWTIPGYSNMTSVAGAVFNYIGANVNDINKGGYLAGSMSSVEENYVARIDAAHISNNRSIVKMIESNGNYYINTNSSDDIVEDYSYVLGGEREGMIGYNLYDSLSAYKVSQNNAEKLQLCMDYGTCRLKAESAAGHYAIFDRKGYVEVNGESAGYRIAMTFNDDYPTKWFGMQIVGSNADTVSMLKRDDGYLLEADNFENVTVTANNREDTAEVKFSTSEKEVLVCENAGGNLDVMIDSNHDGVFETSVSATVQVNPFTDVAEGKFYHDPVLWAISQDPVITTGVTDTTFMPDRICTRAHVVTFLWRANGCPEPTDMTNTFKDVPNGKYYTKAVLWAAETGITTGYSDGTFRPDAECTRGQVVTFLWRAKGMPTPTKTDNPFTDVPAGKYYTTAVLWALENNITKGRTATTFGPDDACTRGHVVTFLYRAYA